MLLCKSNSAARIHLSYQREKLRIIIRCIDSYELLGNQDWVMSFGHTSAGLQLLFSIEYRVKSTVKNLEGPWLSFVTQYAMI